MGRYLSNLLRSGARPIGRKAGPLLRAPAIPELNVERVAAPPEPVSATASPSVGAPAPVKQEPVAAEPEPQVRAPEPEPAAAETPIVPAPAQTAWPPVERPKPEPEPFGPAWPEPLPEVPLFPVPAPVANLAATAALPPEPVRGRSAPQGESPKRSTPPARVPAPAQVETKPQVSVGAATERLMAHRDVRVPQWPAGATAPRVEFITSERVVTLLPAPAAVEREHPARRGEGAPAPTIQSPREAPAVRAARPPAAPVRAIESLREAPALPPARPPAAPKSEAPPPTPRPVARRESIAPAPAPAVPASATQAVRRDPESGIHIRHLDIQIVNEEPRKPARRGRPAAPAAQPAASLGLARHYIREVV
jgi:hypothetical protein